MEIKVNTSSYETFWYEESIFPHNWVNWFGTAGKVHVERSQKIVTILQNKKEEAENFSNIF